jgi:hypothetical protein
MAKQFRTITVNDEEYKYKIGRTAVKIRKPDGTGQLVGLVELTGNRNANEQMEDRELSITPGIIAAYIRNNIVEGE